MLLKQPHISSRHTIRSSKMSHATSLSLSHPARPSPSCPLSLTSEQLYILKFGLTHSIHPPRINESDVFTCFELINHTMAKKLRDTKQAGKLVADLSHLAHTHVSSYRPTTTDLKKLDIINSESSESTFISESDEVEDVVTKNRNLLTVEFQRKTCAAKSLLKTWLAQPKRSFSIWRHSVHSPQIPHARSRTIGNSVLTGHKNSRI